MNVADFEQAERQRLLIIGFGWLLVLVAAVFAYMPGLNGPFMLDDFGSIAALGDYDGVKDWQTFRAFVFGGHSGPTGRPLALLTFLIDANNWPADPFPFKRTNLVIHLVNGALLGVLINQVMRLLDYSRQAAWWIALVSAACWMLHPFLVSTTLYAVQRMAQLSTLFVFAGLAAYIYGRSYLQTRTRKAYVIMSLSIAVFTFLAMISKENGILLPVLVGVLEVTVIASQRGRLGALNRYWMGAFVLAPTVVIFLYLGNQFLRSDFFEIVPPRDFSRFERLLTQPRILLDYLQHWFVPKLYTTGVFQDHFIKSTGLFSPLTTVLSIAFHVVVITASIVYRRKQPLLAMAALFFYAGHLLESTTLNLELYFEHRNYLAAGFLFVPLVAVLQQKLRSRGFIFIALGLLTVLSGFTRYSATVWETYPGIVEASASKAPTSSRAQALYASILFNAGYGDEALQVLERTIEILPTENAHLQVNRLLTLCRLDQLDIKEYERVAGILTKLNYDPRLLRAFNEFAKVVVLRECPAITIESLEPMFVEMLKVPRQSDPTTLEYSNIKFLLGYVYVYSGKPKEALLTFEESLRSKPDASYAMAMAALMATGQHYEEALQLANLAMSHLAMNKASLLQGVRVSESDIREFQKTVRADLDARQDDGTSGPTS